MEGECKLATSATLGPRRSVNTAGWGAILTFWHPSEILPQATPHTRSGWNGEDGVQKSQSFPLILLKEEEFIYPQSVEPLTLCYWSVLENEERTGRKDPTWSVGAFLSLWWGKLTVLCSNTYVFCSQAQTPAGSQGFLSDLRTLKHCLTLKTTEYLPLWVALLNKMPLKKEVELLGRELVPFENCICVRGAGLFTVFPENWFKSRVKSRKGIKAVQELITMINFAETSWCFADSLVLFLVKIFRRCQC